jgi:superoxide dismutase, Cu-Zn family
MRALLLAPVLFLSACAASAHQGHVMPQATGPVGATATADVLNGAGATIGTARFTEGTRGVLIRLELAPGSIAAGWHGAHLHESGDCADFAAGFKAAGAHAGHAPTGQPTIHGLLNPAGPEAGDLTNFHAPAAGPIGAEFYAPGVTLAATPVGARAPLKGPAGSALILHANADDHTSQPIGGAGGRVACAALKP